MQSSAQAFIEKGQLQCLTESLDMNQNRQVAVKCVSVRPHRRLSTSSSCHYLCFHNQLGRTMAASGPSVCMYSIHH